MVGVQKISAVLRSRENKIETAILNGILTKILRGLAPRPNVYLDEAMKLRGKMDRQRAEFWMEKNRWY